MLPINRKVVSADGNSLGPISEVHLKFKVGKIDFNDAFVILNNLQRDIILGLPWQCNFRIGCTWKREGKHLLTIKNKFLTLSLTSQSPNQLVKTKCQCTLQSRSITWISVKTPRNIQTTNLLKINIDRQLPKENVQSSYSLKHHNVKANADSHPSKPLLPAFPDSSSFTTHAHNSDKSPIQLQDSNV